MKLLLHYSHRGLTFNKPVLILSHAIITFRIALCQATFHGFWIKHLICLFFKTLKKPTIDKIKLEKVHLYLTLSFNSFQIQF